MRTDAFLLEGSKGARECVGALLVSDYLLDDDHSVTTGSAFVRIYSRIMLCTSCFFSISFLKGFFLQKQERLLDVYPKRSNEDQHDSNFYSLEETLVMSPGF